MKIGAIFMALSLTLFGNWFTDLFDSTPTPPLSLPIDLSKAGSSVKSEVRVKEDGGYYFTLEFVYTNEIKEGVSDSGIVQKIIGYNKFNFKTGERVDTAQYQYMYNDLKKDGIIIDKNYTGDGTEIALKLIVKNSLNNKIIKEKIYHTKGLMGITTSMVRDFEKLSLKEGNYMFKIENLKSIKEMQGRKANIRFGRYGNGK